MSLRFQALLWPQGFGYVKFSHSASAMAALEQLNGLEFPPASGHYLKVQLRLATMTPFAGASARKQAFL